MPQPVPVPVTRVRVVVFVYVFVSSATLIFRRIFESGFKQFNLVHVTNFNYKTVQTERYIFALQTLEHLDHVFSLRILENNADTIIGFRIIFIVNQYYFSAASTH